MKLLLDQNLSYRLLAELEADFPGSAQVRRLGLDQVPDTEIWQFARDGGFAIVTKDADFLELSLLRGIPPKVVWLNLGNVSNQVVRDVLLRRRAAIADFLRDGADGVLELE